MASANFQLAGFRKESVKGFEVKQTLLRNTVTTDGIREGLTYRFLVVDSNGTSAKTRGLNGQIIYDSPNRNGYVATMTEYHGTSAMTGFNIFTSQGESLMYMQDQCFAQINRQIDDGIIDILDTGTISINAVPEEANFNHILKAKGRLGTNKVPNDSGLTLLVTPYYHASMLRWSEFKNVQEVGRTPIVGADGAWSDEFVFYRWMNTNIVVHPNLPGAGTATETCYLYHKAAVGHAFAMDEERIVAGYDDKQDESYARMTSYQGTVKLQDSGIIKISHNASAYL